MDNDSPSQQAYIAIVLSVLGCLGCGGCLTSTVGLILGYMERQKIASGESSAAGQTLATAAMGIGAATIVLYGLAICAYIVIMALGVGGSMMSTY